MDNKNIMLLFLSDYKEESKELEYQTDIAGMTIRGRQTADAPTKYYIKLLKNNGGLDKILCVTSKKSKDRGLSAYKEMIKGYCDEEGIDKDIEIIEIPYDYYCNDEDGEMENYEKTVQIYDYISKNVTSEDNIYIDYTGGLRDFALLMMIMISYMESMGVKCRKIIYSNFFDKRIYNITYIYDLIHVINGVSEFMQNGSVKLLRQSIKNIGEDKIGINDMLDAMDHFSDTIALCMIDSIDDVLKELNDAISKMRKLRHEVEVKSEDEVIVPMLLSLLEIIENKFMLSYESVTYPHVISWCVENNFMQQAITFYIEKMPKFYIDNNIIEMEDCETNKQESNISEESSYFYETLFDSFAVGKEEKNFIDFIKNNVKAYVSDPDNMEVLKRKSEYVLERIKEINENEWRQDYEEPVNRMIEFAHIKILGAKRKLMNEKLCESMLEKINAKDINKVWNSIISGWLPYIWRNDNKKNLDTYEKKICALEKLSLMSEKVLPNISNEDLLELMEYYLAMKIIRNKINHANEGESIRCVEEYLKRNKRDYTTEIKVENVKKILEKAIKKSLDVERTLRN